ncbi:hypothetical protein KQI19_02270 [Enterococcus gallinarum]|uniref:hypothetical protein n=1 Tax=Enterococcus gallinarum TaxID=1353 RepID=UPI0018AB5AAD|nr:hypothetical protein [Enterococcus gallinarum]MBU5356974.1 hypothetical protein [Enterococcus gallinarum]MEB6062664.1 hypothetical protein [Enterococcus gallinarum]
MNNSIQNVIIYYDNYEDIELYLNELNNQVIDDIDFFVTLVMNKFNTDDLRGLEILIDSISFQCELIFPNGNLGYLNGLLYGYRKSQFRKENLDWVIFSNTDIEIPNKFFIKKFLATNYSDDIVCVAPSVFSKELNAYSNPQYKTRYTKRELLRRVKIFNNKFLANMYFSLSDIKLAMIKKNKEDSCYVYSAHGSFFFLRRNFLDKLNKSYMSLMYSEEAFIAEEVLKQNGRIYYDSRIEVEHLESKVTGKLGKQKKAKYIAESLEKIIEEYF